MWESEPGAFAWMVLEQLNPRRRRRQQVLRNTCHCAPNGPHARPPLVLPGFVVDALAEIAEGKSRDELLWPSRTGGHLAPPSASHAGQRQ
ncbi:hypothetical protein [Mycobacterium sp.]|uniref:hypothetical protein n=1 Tax=Mycobacterium sp. TaxID=1785 RepID=UPI003F95A202